MLNEEEEQRVQAFLNASDKDLEKDTTYSPEYYKESVRWLASKLLEINNAAREQYISLKEHEDMVNYCINNHPPFPVEVVNNVTNKSIERASQIGSI